MDHLPVRPPIGVGIHPHPSAQEAIDRFRDQAVFKKLDADGDGVLSPNEFRDSRTNVGRFAKYDADKDGNIDVKEYTNARRWERFTEKFGDWLPIRRDGSESKLLLKGKAFAGAKAAEG